VSNITFTESGIPFSPKFNDIYFDQHAGFQQSQQVFVEGNNLPARFEHKLTNFNNTEPFVIAESGFGTGLNFLLTWLGFNHVKAKVLNTLTEQNTQKFCWQFISIEKYPLTRQQLKQSLQLFPEIHELSDQLVAQYPETPTRNVTLYFANNEITLTLIFDDIVSGLMQLPSSKTGLVDAWFLDGFSPATNPEMWQTPVFTQMARLAKPQASIATFTVAGFVKRGLESVGFRVKKQHNKGKKTQILVGKYQQHTRPENHFKPLQSFKKRTSRIKPQQVTIIGGGIASACAAYVLTQNGIKVHIVCKDEKVAQGASSNAIGALYPLIRQRADVHSYFYQQAFDFAKIFYQQIVTNGAEFAHQWCGLIDLAYTKELQTRQQKFSTQPIWPSNLIHGINAKQASDLAGITLPYGGMFMPNAGWVAPQQLVEQLFILANKTNRLKITTNFQVQKLQALPNQRWQLISNKNKRLTDEIVIICAGADSISIAQCHDIPLTAMGGQVTQVAATNKTSSLKTVLCHKGYITPANLGQHCIGATFNKDERSTKTSISRDSENLATVNECLPQTFDWQTSDIIGSKMRARCMTLDHLPIVGAVPDVAKHIQQFSHLSTDKNWHYASAAPYVENLYLLTGLGARGLCSAPLLAEILNAELCGLPYPVDDDLLFNLAANRFVIKDLIKQRSS
jgi:tRNA 5-methylaminomethyl-2-thiouridine biosynthesis bifunctional protein